MATNPVVVVPRDPRGRGIGGAWVGESAGAGERARDPRGKVIRGRARAGSAGGRGSGAAWRLDLRWESSGGGRPSVRGSGGRGWRGQSTLYP
jgi:hypothetical protein